MKALFSPLPLLLSLMLSIAQAEDRLALKLGLITPLSGSRASIGADARDGALLALEDLTANKELNDGQLEVVFEDSQGDPGKGVQAFNKLLLAGVRFIITQNSNVSLPISPLANQNKVIQLAITTTADRYSSPGDYTFRTNGSTLYEAGLQADYLQARLLTAPGAIGLITMQDEYPVTLRGHLLEELNRRGLSLAVNEEYLPVETDFRTIISKLRAKKVDYVLHLGYQTQCGNFVKQLKEMGLRPRLVLSNTPVNNKEFFTAAGDAADGVILSYPQIDASHEATARFRQKYGRDPNLFSANAYDAIMIAAKASKACGYTAESDCLKRALFSIKNYSGLSGHKSFDSLNGDMQDQYTLLIAKDGKFVPLSR